MQNAELDQIEASIKSMVKRAYDLGRSDTLQKVVDELRALDPNAEPVVDAPLVETEAPALAEIAPVPDEASPEEAAPVAEPVFKPLPRPAKPWWARLGR